MHIGMAGIGLYIPSQCMTAAELAQATGVPEDVIALKFGIKKKPIASKEETTSYMGLKAAEAALSDAQYKA